MEPRKLTETEAAKLQAEHIRLLNEIDRTTAEKKDTVAGYNETIKEMCEKERSIRHTLQTGLAEAEQIDLFAIVMSIVTDQINTGALDSKGHTVTATLTKGVQ